MALRLATTRVQLLSAGEDDTEAEDWGGAPDAESGYAPVGEPVRAHFSAPQGSSAVTPAGSTSTVDFHLLTDPCELEEAMRVRDLATGRTYDVEWCLPRGGRLAHVVAGVTRVRVTS